LEILQVRKVEGVRAADGQGDSVERHRVALHHLVEHVQGPTAGIEEVLGQDLEPVDGWMLGEDVAEVDGAEAYPDPEVRQIPAVGHWLGPWHARAGSPSGEEPRAARARGPSFTVGLLLLFRLYRDRAAALALAGVLAGAPLVARLAAALPLAVVLP